MRRAKAAARLAALVTVAAALCGACAGPPRPGGRKVYAQHRDSITAHCPHNPEVCAAALGAADGIPPLVTAGGSMAMAGAFATTVVVEGDSLDIATQSKVDAALKECADQARSAMLTRYFSRRGPTQEDCDEVLDPNPGGEPVTRAMQLGSEMHRTAFGCVQQKLGELLSGRFSIEQRYRYDPLTGKTTVVSAEEAKLLLRQGRGAELRGTIKPDVVIHSGNPRSPQAVYDLKFPCVNTDQRPQWRKYPSDHPFSGKTQYKVYGDALGQRPAMVVPRLGVIR